MMDTRMDLYYNEIGRKLVAVPLYECAVGDYAEVDHTYTDGTKGKILRRLDDVIDHCLEEKAVDKLIEAGMCEKATACFGKKWDANETV